MFKGALTCKSQLKACVGASSADKCISLNISLFVYRKTKIVKIIFKDNQWHFLSIRNFFLYNAHIRNLCRHIYSLRAINKTCSSSISIIITRWWPEGYTDPLIFFRFIICICLQLNLMRVFNLGFSLLNRVYILFSLCCLFLI